MRLLLHKDKKIPMETMETIIEYKGRMFPFKKSIHMCDKMFYDRCWFIVKNQGVENIEAYADMWISFKYFESKYSDDIMEKIKELENNMMKQ